MLPPSTPSNANGKIDAADCERHEYDTRPDVRLLHTVENVVVPLLEEIRDALCGPV